MAFQKRDIRGTYGGGERTLAYWMLLELHKHYPDTIEILMHDLPNYGSWLDFNKMYDILYHDVKATERQYTNAEYPSQDMLKDVKGQRFLMNLIVGLYVEQIRLDLVTLQNSKNESGSSEDKTISLAAKWIPKEGRSLDNKTGIYLLLAKNNDLTTGKGKPTRASVSLMKKDFRKVVSALNREIKTTETLMCSNQWDKINFRLVPGRCLNKFHRSWMNEQKDGSIRVMNSEIREQCKNNYQSFLELVKQGKVSAKGKSLFIHEIVNEVINSTSPAYMSRGNLAQIFMNWKQNNPERYALLNAQFDDHVNAIDEYQQSLQGDDVGLGETVFLADVSGSMSGNPMGTSVGASIIGSYFNLEEGYHNRVLTFESQPRWVSLDYPKTRWEFNSEFNGYSGNNRFPIGDTWLPERVGKELDWLEKIHVLSCAGWGGSTNFLAAVDMICDVAEKFNVDLPKRVLCITDMQWDAADCSRTSLAPKSNILRNMSQLKGNYQTLFDKIKQCFLQLRLKATKLPEFICWNVNGRSADRGFPAGAFDDKLKMISGFNTSMLKLFLNEGTLESTGETNSGSSWDLLKKMLDDDNYDKVREVCGQTLPIFKDKEQETDDDMPELEDVEKAKPKVTIVDGWMKPSSKDTSSSDQSVAKETEVKDKTKLFMELFNSLSKEEQKEILISTLM